MIKVTSKEEQNYTAPGIKVIDVEFVNPILAGSTEDPEDEYI